MTRGFCIADVSAAQARPSRPAASSRLMLISEPRCSGFGSAMIAMVCVEHEHAEIGDVLAQRRPAADFPSWWPRSRRSTTACGYSSSAASSSGLLVVPAVADRLQPRGRVQQQVGFQLTRIGGLLRDRAVGSVLRVACIEQLLLVGDKRLGALQAPCTCRRLRCDC